MYEVNMQDFATRFQITAAECCKMFMLKTQIGVVTKVYLRTFSVSERRIRRLSSYKINIRDLQAPKSNLHSLSSWPVSF